MFSCSSCTGNHRERVGENTRCLSLTLYKYLLVAPSFLCSLTNTPPLTPPRLQHQWPRGLFLNDPHEAAHGGSTERTAVASLSRGLINIGQGDPEDCTPLMLAAQEGRSRVIRILLNKGAHVSIAANGDATVLHLSAQNGHLTVTVDLIKAGADLEARTFDGCTPLYVAVQQGYSEVVAALIEAGAEVNCDVGNWNIPLPMAALYNWDI